MTHATDTRPTSTLLIFGASGDLTARLLLPALGQLLAEQPTRTVQLIGVGAEELTDEAWREKVAASFATVPASGPSVDALLASTRYLTSDVTDAGSLRSIFAACDGAPAIYFALPPAVTAQSCVALEDVDLPAGTILALEKPFGTDEAGAVALNQQLTKLLPEDRIHRVDHFLGRSTVFNVLGVRFANRIFEPLWNAEHIAKVEIVYDEQLGLEARAGYYDHAGALVDMIQSHLLQVLAVIAMEPPATLNAADLRDAKGLVLRATRVRHDDPALSSRRARYTAGEVEGRAYPSYADEAGVDPAHQTETLAEVTVEIDTWRWAGVPFLLRSGKALGKRRREIIVTFKPANHVPSGFSGRADATVLRLMLAPDEMSLELNVNGPGDPWHLGRASLDVEFGPGQLLAYGEVLEGILDGDPALSVRGDTAEQCWRIVEPVLTAWRNNDVPLDEYPAGSEGPRHWRR